MAENVDRYLYRPGELEIVEEPKQTPVADSKLRRIARRLGVVLHVHRK